MLSMSQLSPYQQTQLARYGNPQHFTSEQLATMPVEYATGRAEFCGLPLFVSSDVLIPRIETEELVELALQTVSEKMTHHYPTKQTLRIAEVGTGSGAISIALAKHAAPFASDIEIIAGDISAAALTVAKKNQATFLTPTDCQLKFIESDLLTIFTGKFSLILANLPYIPTARISQLAASVREHEPQLALDGGPAGLTLIYKLLDQAINYLEPNGVVLLEIDDSHSLVDFRQFAQYFEVSIIQDSFGKNRFAQLLFTQATNLA